MNQQLTIPIPPQPGAWTPPVLDAFAHGYVLAFDQSLNNTGWCLLHHSTTGMQAVSTGMIHPPADDLTSFEATFTRGSHVEEGVSALVEQMIWSVRGAQPPLAIIFERPAITGHRIESALLSGYGVFKATDGTARMVSNVHAKKVIVGRAGTRENPVTKGHVKEAVERYVPPPHPNRWNEHIRDACMLALTHLYDAAKEPKA